MSSTPAWALWIAPVGSLAGILLGIATTQWIYKRREDKIRWLTDRRTAYAELLRDISQYARLIEDADGDPDTPRQVNETEAEAIRAAGREARTRLGFVQLMASPEVAKGAEYVMEAYRLAELRVLHDIDFLGIDPGFLVAGQERLRAVMRKDLGMEPVPIERQRIEEIFTRPAMWNSIGLRKPFPESSDGARPVATEPGPASYSRNS
jgi:hypothetical protein